MNHLPTGTTIRTRLIGRVAGGGIAVVLVALLAAGCGGGGDGDGGGTPVIESVIATPEAVVPGGSVTLQCNASDPNGEPLQFSWFIVSGLGLFPAGYTASQVSWVAPDSTSVVAISVTVSDASHRVTGTVNVDVRDDAPFLDAAPPALNFGVGSIDTLESGSPTHRTDTLYVDITNRGGSALTWSAAADRPWVNLSPLSGVTTSEHDSVRVIVDRSGLAPGYSGAALTLSSDGGVVTIPIAVWTPQAPAP